MKLLVVDDDEKILSLLRGSLESDGYETVGASSAEQAMGLLSAHHFEGYLLDVVLPGLSGFDLCRWLRESGIKEPILLLTARGDLSDKVEGLDAGADDYLAKPFELAEVKARLRALRRKVQGYPRPSMKVADLVLDPNARTVRRGNQDLVLSKKEFALLEYLVRNKDRLVTRAMIASSVWDSDTSMYTNVIDVFINYLRKKVDLDGLPKLIVTVRGKGFMISEAGQPNLPVR